MSFRVRRHGGGCCGATHLHGFNYRQGAQLENIRKLRAHTNGARKKGHLLEIVLTNRQMQDQPEVVVEMKELGWKRTAVWYNRNSGNYCNQFVYHRNPQRGSVIEY